MKRGENFIASINTQKNLEYNIASLNTQFELVDNFEKTLYTTTGTTVKHKISKGNLENTIEKFAEGVHI